MYTINTLRNPWVAAFAAAAALALASCSDNAPAPEPAQPEPAAAVKPAKAPEPRHPTIRVEQGKEVDLVKHLPSDVPAYPTATPSRIIVRKSGDRIATFETADTPEKVQAFYAEKLASEGWKMGSNSSAGGLYVLKGSKDERTVSVTIPKPEAGGETRVTVVASE